MSSSAQTLDKLWQTLTCPELAGVRVLRLDRFSDLAPGNKAFKLAPFLSAARARGMRRLLSFGGPWSNHLHALAALGAAQGFETVGFVRGLEADALTPTLLEARHWGMQLVGLDRRVYRHRAEARFQAELLQSYGPGLLIPEGGDSAEGAAGCRMIGEAIARATPEGATVVMAVGTGTTLAGVVTGLRPRHRVVGISALKGALDTERRIRNNLLRLNCQPEASWALRNDFHCGGFARVSAELRQWLLDSAVAREVPLEPVYTAKAMCALQSMLEGDEFDPGLPVVLLHTGGLQGRRGYPWLDTGSGQ